MLLCIRQGTPLWPCIIYLPIQPLSAYQNILVTRPPTTNSTLLRASHASAAPGPPITTAFSWRKLADASQEPRPFVALSTQSSPSHPSTACRSGCATIFCGRNPFLSVLAKVDHTIGLRHRVLTRQTQSTRGNTRALRSSGNAASSSSAASCGVTSSIVPAAGDGTT